MILDRLLELLAASYPAWHAEYTNCSNQLQQWLRSGLIPDPAGRVVWDLGCGWGPFSVAFVQAGARDVVATDTFLDRSQIPQELLDSGLVRFIEGDTQVLAPSVLTTDHTQPSLVFMHLMTEHVADLPALFRALRAHISIDARLFIHHDNYYQPVGHHDHGFLRWHPESNEVRSQAVTCWESPDRCATSQDHRMALRRDRPWQWSEASEATRCVDCVRCNYRIRAQPWAHLLAADRFLDVFPEQFFTNGLNKVTVFQLHQHLVESGFKVINEERIILANEPPPQLLAWFAPDELKTFVATIVAAPAGAACPNKEL